MRARLIASDKQAYSIAVFTLLIGLFILQAPAKFATADANSWISTDPTVEVGRDATAEDIRSPRTCYPESWQYYSYTNAQNNQSNTPRLLTVDECSVNGIGKNYVHVGYAYMKTGSNSIFGIPNNNNVLVSERSYTGDMALGIGGSLASSGTFKAPQPSNTNVGEYKPNPPARPFKDTLGRTISFNYNNWSFSPNGKYMVAEVLYHGLVRIDIETEEITLFSNQTYTYGMGYNPTPQLGISNDGKTAVVANFEGGALNIYDLTDCTTKVITATNNIATGCASPRNIAPLMKSKQSGYLILNGIRFADNDKSIYGVSYRKDPTTKELKYQKVTLNMAGYAPQPVNYIAMGDSFASGEGDMDGRNWYEDGTDTDHNKCHLSKRSYPYLINQYLDNKEFHSVACSGAKANNISTIVQYPKNKSILTGAKPQLEYFAGEKPAYITLSIGGNDVGFSSKVSACVLNYQKVTLPETCIYAKDQTARASVAKEIADQYTDLRKTYEEVIKATNGETKIYVMGYPQFVRGEGGNCGNNVHLDDAEREFVYKSVKYMNQVIKASATDAGVYYLDIESTLESKNLCSGATDSSMAINGVTFGNDEGAWVNATIGGKVIASTSLGLGNESFHPNQNAQPLIRDRILQLTNNNPATFVTCPNSPDLPVCGSVTSRKIPLPDSSYFSVELSNYINSRNGVSTIPVALPPKQAQMITADSNLQTTSIHMENLQPSSPVKLEVHSNPVDLGTFYTDALGNLDVTLDFQGKVAPGAHELHAYSKNIAGVSQEYYQHILITGQEGDVNGNNTPDSQEKCGFVPDSGINYDQDGVDDACDGLISEPPLPPEPDPIIIPEPTPVDVIQPSEDPNKKPLGESVAGWGDEIVPALTAIQIQSRIIPSTTISPASQAQPILAQASDPVALTTNNPQASSSIADSFNNSTSKEKPEKINTQDTKRNYYILVLIIPLAIILVIIFKFIQVKYAKAKNF